MTDPNLTDYGYSDPWEEHNDFHYSTDTEWDQAEAYEKGAANPEQAWISTTRDAWHKNPYYTGPDVPHPEDYDPEDDY